MYIPTRGPLVTKHLAGTLIQDQWQGYINTVNGWGIQLLIQRFFIETNNLIILDLVILKISVLDDLVTTMVTMVTASVQL